MDQLTGSGIFMLGSPGRDGHPRDPFRLPLDCSIWVAPLALVLCSFRTSCWRSLTCRKADVCLFPKQFDEKVAKLHLPALGEAHSVPTQEQADCSSVEL